MFFSFPSRINIFQVIDHLHCTLSMGWVEVETPSVLLATQKILILSSCIVGVYTKVLVVTCRPFTVVIADVAPVSMVSSVESGLPVSLYHLILAAGKPPDVTQRNVVGRPAIRLMLLDVGWVNVTPVMGTERKLTYSEHTLAIILYIKKVWEPATCS